MVRTGETGSRIYSNPLYYLWKHSVNLKLLKKFHFKKSDSLSSLSLIDTFPCSMRKQHF